MQQSFQILLVSSPFKTYLFCLLSHTSIAQARFHFWKYTFPSNKAFHFYY